MIAELDKSRSTSKRGIGSSIFSSSSSSVPSELAPLVPHQQTITKLVLSTKTSVNAASMDYEKLTDPAAVTPSAPVHAARLNGLLKTLANAEGAVAESIKARRQLLEGLEKILDANRVALAAEELQLNTLSERRTEIDTKKRDVEDSIMRGFATNSNPGTPAGLDGSPESIQTPHTPAPEPDRPEVEALTPPGFPKRPSPSPAPELAPHATDPRDRAVAATQETVVPPPAAAGFDLLSSLSGPYSRPIPTANSGSAKKRKLDNDDFPDLGGDAMDGLDADVAEMLRQDSGSGSGSQ